MNRSNYSNNASPLLDIEIDDFDTKSYIEEGSHPTGINEDRMRLPTRYDISKFYKRNKRPSSYDKYGNPRFEKGQWRKKSAEELADISDDFNWQITYSFPAVRRNPLTSNGEMYGGANVTFRRLYLILCERFNGGRFFIDDYFDTVYPHTIKPEVDERLRIVKNELLDVASVELSGAVATASGDFDKRYKINRGMKAKLARYEAFASSWEASEGQEVAYMIKDDIINCMLSGQLQLECVAHSNTPGTERERIRAGLSPEPVFLATAQLIESLQLFVSIGGNRKWQTRQGILV